MGRVLFCQLPLGCAVTPSESTGALAPLAPSCLGGDLPGVKVLSTRTCFGNKQLPVQVSDRCVLCVRPPGAPLVKALPVNPTDPAVTGPDIFAKLVPMAAHEASSLYRWVPGGHQSQKTSWSQSWGCKSVTELGTSSTSTKLGTQISVTKLNKEPVAQPSLSPGRGELEGTKLAALVSSGSH